MDHSLRFLQAHRAEIEKTMPAKAAQAILVSLEKHYYSHKTNVFMDEGIQGDILANLVRRQAAFETYLVPWIKLRRSLVGATVVDIGCGTGSSTAALARVAGKVRGYEIATGSTSVADDRLKSLGLSNASVSLVNPDETMDIIKRDFPDGVDVIALIAVLEHMTPKERSILLPQLWDYMRPGNILVVSELPNRLTYNDDHTAQMPFFHMLPLDLKRKYVDRSPRADFTEDLLSNTSSSDEQVELLLARWGIGLSYHDFEIGFGVRNLDHVLLADGFEYETIQWWPPQIEERILMEYFVRKSVNKPLGFCRSVLNLIFVKPEIGATGGTLKHDESWIKNLWQSQSFSPAGLDIMRPLFAVK
jgi:2-polyprenyl-3-methyl-5-hydroxy-6-metoxy-1,4-benzoquinol methylase